MTNTYLALNNQLNIPENGAIPLYKDKEAVRAYFLEHVNQKWKFSEDLDEQIRYLIENGYYEKEVFDMYSWEFIESLWAELRDRKFRFQSFMGAYKFFKQYAMTTSDGTLYLERYEDRVAMNALVLGNGDEKLARSIAEEIITNRYQPATPTFLSAGRKNRGEYISCFLLDVDDDLNSIGRLFNSSAQLSSIGGGVGISLSNIRALGDPIKNVENASNGVVPIMKILEGIFRYANQMG